MSLLVLLQPDEVGPAIKAFPIIGEYIREGVAESRGRITMAWVGTELRADRMRLWLCVTEPEPGQKRVIGASLTQIVQEPSGLKICFIAFCAGHGLLGEGGLKHLQTIERWAFTQQGCRRMVIQGRKGWGRLLRGYSPSYGYELDLHEGLWDNVQHVRGRIDDREHGRHATKLDAVGTSPIVPNGSAGNGSEPVQSGGAAAVHGSPDRRVH